MDYPISFYSCTDPAAYPTPGDIGIATTTTIDYPGFSREYSTGWVTTEGTIYDRFTNTNGDTSSYVAISSFDGIFSGIVPTTVTGGLVTYGDPEGSWLYYTNYPSLNPSTTRNSDATAYGTFLKIPAGYIGPITQTESTTSYIASDLLWTSAQSYLEIAVTELAAFLDYSTTTVADVYGYGIVIGSYGQWQSTSTSTTYLETYWADTFITSETTRTYSGSTEADSVWSVTNTWTNYQSTGAVYSNTTTGSGYFLQQTTSTGYFYRSDNAISLVALSNFASPIEELPTFSYSTSYTYVTVTDQLAFAEFIQFSENTTDREISLWQENVLTYDKAYGGMDFKIFPTTSSSYSYSWKYDFPANELPVYNDIGVGYAAGPVTSFLVPRWHDVLSTAAYPDLTSSFSSIYPFGFSSFGSYTQEVQGIGNLAASTFAFTCQKTAPVPFLRVWESGGFGSATTMSSLALSGMGGNWDDLSNTYYALNFGTLEHSILELQFSTGYQQPAYYVPESQALAFKVVNVDPAYIQNGKSFTFQIGATSLVSSSTISTYHTTLIEITDGEIDQTSFQTSYVKSVGEVMDGSYTFQGLVAFTTWNGTSTSSTWSNFSQKSTFQQYSSSNSFVEFGSIFSAVADCYLPFTLSHH